MQFLTRYIAYLKDNPEGYWFKRKAYGWGWVPARWQGWYVIGAFILIITIDAFRLSRVYPDVPVLSRFIPQTIFLVGVLIVICFVKGERPAWQWGIPLSSTE